jgi:hypothetical protein
MDANITLVDYRKLSKELPFLEPFDECCGSSLVDTIYIEPMIRRRGSEKRRSCVVQCLEVWEEICNVVGVMRKEFSESGTGDFIMSIDEVPRKIEILADFRFSTRMRH